MKRTPLRRLTPLRRGGPLRRTAMPRPKPRPPEDRVSPEMHRHILERDKVCFLWRIDHTHVCRFLGIPHAPDDLSKLTVDHFWLDGGHMGDRAPSTPRHLVAMCRDGNVANPSEQVRQKERAYTADLEAHGRL